MSARRAVAPPRDLTIPSPSSTTAYEVLSRALGRIVLEARPIIGARAAALVDDVGALASALRRPEIGVLVRALREAAGPSREALTTELVALVAFERARTHALPCAVRVERLPRRILSSAAGVTIDVPRDAAAATFAAGRVTFERTDRAEGSLTLDLDALATATPTAVRRTFHDLDTDILFATEDNNPLAMVEAHPDKSGNAVDLGGRGVEEWLTALRDALALVRAHLPELFAEMGLFRLQIVPVGYDAERHLSASYREAIGTIYLTLHPSLMTMTEAIVHELSHNKMNALFEIDDVLENAFAPLFSSPVRPDPRPLHGVLLAVHAFLPIARLYERMIDLAHPLADGPAFRARFAEIVRINREGAKTILDHARPTPVGRALLDEIARWDEHYRPFA